MTFFFIIHVSQPLRGSSSISKLHIGIYCYPDIVPTSHSILYRQTEFAATTDFFSLDRWDPNASLWPSGPCLIMVDASRAGFGHSPSAHCSSPSTAQLPIGSNSSDSRSSQESTMCCWRWRAKCRLFLILSVDSDVWLL